MRNLRLWLKYNGTAYHGWQIQENADTVQGQLEEAAEQIFCEKISVNGCSRTDAGVHANEFCCNFRTDKQMPCETVVKALNAKLPLDIVVLRCEEVPLEFHARFDTKSKEYIYKIWNSELRNPFLLDTVFQYIYKLNESELDKAAKDFIGTYDYSAFCASGSSVHDKVRTVFDASVTREGDMIIFKVSGDGFLYNMVRIMVGTLIYINEGKIGKDDIKDIILSLDRNKAGKTVSPEGLYLNKVNY
ncbi:MAG: tRNA pseudouridine(38-40) synthase TruA [Clostridia bacterium]|nr:tRNA pseudouridine(38-40) synthase TruA [Clostridia bacterium]